nr:amidohydrolase family protein [Lactobacillus delbrueckii]
MVHIGTNLPELSDIFALLQHGDIITHCFNGKPNGIMNLGTKQIKQFAIEGYNRGIIFDIGHGTESFSFDVAESATKIGMKPKTVSSDLYHGNCEAVPVYNLATVVDKMLYLGYDLREIIPMITKNPAEDFNLKGKGELKVGADGDLTIFNIEKRPQGKLLTDFYKQTRTTNTVVVPTYAVVGGQVYETNKEVF